MSDQNVNPPDVSESPSSGHWLFQSGKTGQRVVVRAALTHDYLTLLECRADVKAYDVHVPVETVWQNKMVKSVFDVRVEYTISRTEYVNVLQAASLDDAHVKEEIEIQRLWATANGQVAIVVTEVEVRAEPMLLANSHLLSAFLRIRSGRPASGIVQRVLGVLVQIQKPISIEALAQEANLSPELLLRVLAPAHVEGRVVLDLTSRMLGQQTIVRLNPQTSMSS